MPSWNTQGAQELYLRLRGSLCELRGSVVKIALRSSEDCFVQRPRAVTALYAVGWGWSDPRIGRRFPHRDELQ